ncbi:tumor necrosis factor receptor superfamily member 19-like isoform X2 [Dreissena polymorpha]|uniref:tumor necrosis factor receptor superfamily member 19-like isoform X2 n=1 Tax=Dreissena polymorpha TaxID=45954 RepID=UPI002264A0D0|nr:tumor necrosis factor receptor superfamily member 19-like isoform X2 [Dreissena polymorpha]
MSLIPLALAVIIIPVTIQGGPRPCLDNTRYVEIPGIAKGAKKGRCEQCPACDGGGFVLNKTLPREYNARYGFLSCHPCEPCSPRYFRESHSFPVCNLCSKNCSAVNRYESQPCGGSSPGHCGECFPGFKAISSSAEVMCVERPELPKPDLKDVSGAANMPEVSFASGSLHVNVSANARIDANAIIGIIGSVLLAIMAGGVIIWCKRRKHTKTSRRPTKATAGANIGASAARLIRSDTSLEGAVETDGIENENVRGELQQVTFIDTHPGLTHGRSPLEK